MLQQDLIRGIRIPCLAKSSDCGHMMAKDDKKNRMCCLNSDGFIAIMSNIFLRFSLQVVGICVCSSFVC